MGLNVAILPVVTKDLPISPQVLPYDFLSRCKFSTLRTRLIGNPTRDFREVSRGSAALTGIARGGVAANVVIQEKSVLDDPVPEMVSVEPIYLYCIIVHLQYTNT